MLLCSLPSFQDAAASFRELASQAHHTAMGDDYGDDNNDSPLALSPAAAARRKNWPKTFQEEHSSFSAMADLLRGASNDLKQLRERHELEDVVVRTAAAFAPAATSAASLKVAEKVAGLRWEEAKKAAAIRDKENDRRAAECPVCWEFMEDPVQLGCSHAFCRGCTVKLVALGNNRGSGTGAAGCPLCRARISPRFADAADDEKHDGGEHTDQRPRWR